MLPKKRILALFILSIFTLSGCQELVTALDIYTTIMHSDSSSTSGTSSTSSNTSSSRTNIVGNNSDSISIEYTRGDMYGMNGFYSDMNTSFGKTSGALLQAILAVNSVLFTDNSVTSLETFKLRKAKADKALDILATYAKETESIIDSGSYSSKSFKTKSLDLSPDAVLATVSSGPANKQIKTLMTKYQVNAHEAKTILDNAMSGLISSYNKDADFYDKATKTATLIKEGAGLSLTIAGSIVTAGGVTGSLALGEAAITLITGTDGIIKVTKAGLELVLGKDLKQPSGTVGAIATILSDTSEIISFNSLKKWTDASDKISNVFNIALKINDALQDKTLNLGAHTIDISNLNQDTSSLISNNIPTTLTGIYKIFGQSVNVKTLSDIVNNIINALPEEDKVNLINSIASPVPTSTPTAIPSIAETPVPTPVPSLVATPIPTAIPSVAQTAIPDNGNCSTPFDEGCRVIIDKVVTTGN